jgi:hypothetical protein
MFLTTCSWIGDGAREDDSELARFRCAPHMKIPGAPPLPKPELRAFPEIAWRPDSYKMVQRIVLETRGKHYDFVGYLRVHGPADFRALALGEMGGTLFDLSLKEGQPRILKKPGNMPPAPLAEGVIGDISHLFATGALRVLHYTRDERLGNIVLNLWVEADQGPHQANTYWLDETGRLAGSRETWKGKAVRCAAYRDWKTLPGCSRPLPGRIILENYRWHYKMEIELLEFHPNPTNKEEKPQTTP